MLIISVFKRDVYKRQAISGLPPPLPPAACATALTSLPAFTPSALASLPQDAANVTSVSYTHLDVYKRQAIAIVGWDDNYSKENFKAINGVLPENDGAWLVKNSLGDYNTCLLYTSRCV